jgi:precorrin-6A/cobalt-precorrin-6A reductase
VARERRVPVIVLKRPVLPGVDRELLTLEETLNALAAFTQ